MARRVYGAKEMALFRRAIEREAREIAPAAVKDVQIVLSKNIWEQILLTTPVLTGQARYNWFPTLNTPSAERYWFQGSIVIYGRRITAWKNRPEGAADETGEPMNQIEREKFAELMRHLRGLPLGQRVWIVNNLWYVRDLNEGSSTKAPAGIVYVALDRALREVKAGARRRTRWAWGVTDEREAGEGGDRDSVRIGVG